MIEPRELGQVESARKGSIEDHYRPDARFKGAVEQRHIAAEVIGQVLRHFRVPSFAKWWQIPCLTGTRACRAKAPEGETTDAWIITASCRRSESAWSTAWVSAIPCRIS